MHYTCILPTQRSILPFKLFLYLCVVWQVYRGDYVVLKDNTGDPLLLDITQIVFTFILKIIPCIPQYNLLFLEDSHKLDRTMSNSYWIVFVPLHLLKMYLERLGQGLYFVPNSIFKRIFCVTFHCCKTDPRRYTFVLLNCEVAPKKSTTKDLNAHRRRSKMNLTTYTETQSSKCVFRKYLNDSTSLWK